MCLNINYTTCTHIHVYKKERVCNLSLKLLFFFLSGYFNNNNTRGFASQSVRVSYDATETGYGCWYSERGLQPHSTILEPVQNCNSVKFKKE